MRNRWFTGSRKRLGSMAMAVNAMLVVVLAYGCGGSDNRAVTDGLPVSKATSTQVARGRYIVLASGCIDCHNRGKNDPSDPNWMAGYITGTPGQPFQIGPFLTYPANLTPDLTTGIGGHTDQQIYNALTYGLDPASTPDAAITSTTPGVGNFPATPHYLAPPMPWFSTRHLSDSDRWALVAYIKHGIKSVSNAVPPSTGPPNFWASAYTDPLIGPTTIPGYPAANEQFSP